MAVRTGMLRSRPGRLATGAVLLVTASCHQCFRGGPQISQPPVPPGAALTAAVVCSVVVTPESASLTSGATVQFSVVAQKCDGSTAATSVVWAPAGGTVSASGLYTAGNTPGVYLVIAKVDGGTLADTSTVTVYPAPVTPTPGTGLVVRVTGVPASQEKWLLQDTDINAAGMGTCPSDMVTSFSLAEQPVTAVWPGCATELTAFARKFAPVLDVAPAPAVMAGKSVITEPLPAPWTVKVRVVIEYTEARGNADIGIALAKTLFDANAMGLTPEVVEIDSISPDIDPATGKVDPAAMAIKQGCAAVVAQTGLAKPDRLNVFYIREDQWIAEWKPIHRYGYNCYLEDTNHPNIIFLREAHVPATLAHEIGHALSLNHAGLGNTLAGWDPKNLMRPSVFYPADSILVDQFTLGQAYRANVNKSSWLNIGMVRTGATKVCLSGGLLGSSGEHWPCPDVQLDWK